MAKKSFGILMMLSLLFSSVAVFAAPPLPARVGGTLVVNGKQITGNATSYTFVVTKPDGKSYIPAAETKGLNAANWYIIDIPIFDATEQADGAKPGDTAVIHVYKDGSEIPVTLPANGQFTVGESGSTAAIYINDAPPKAVMGPDQTVDEGDLVTLDASGSSDPDDGIASYQWIQLSGKSVTLSDTTAVRPTFTAPNGPTEALVFQLTITDKSGLQDKNTCKVNVVWINDPPHADAGTDQTAYGGYSITLDASMSDDPDDGIFSYKWKQVSGQTVNLSDDTAVRSTFTAPNVANLETIVFELSTMDTGGLQDKDMVTINIMPNVISDGFQPYDTYAPANQPPTADKLYVSTDQDKPVSVKLSGSDPDVPGMHWFILLIKPITYSVVTQPQHGTLSGTAPDLTYTPEAGYIGTDSFTFKLSDGIADSTPATVSIVINPTGSMYVDDSLALNISCAEYQGVRYGFRLDYSKIADDPFGLYWKMDISTFGNAGNAGGSCISVGSDLKINIPSALYKGITYQFSLNYNPVSSDASGHYWKMDLDTFKSN